MANLVHWVLESTVGRVFGKDITCREPVHRCDPYQPGAITVVGETGVRVRCYISIALLKNQII